MIYCASCGTAVADGARFCSRCGTKASAVAERRAAAPNDPNPESLVWALVSTVLGGLALLTGFLVVLKKELEFTNDLVILFALVWLALILAASGGIFWVLLRGRRVAASRPLDELAPPPEPRGLQAPPVSVTEATTRSLEPAAPRSYDTPRRL